MLFEFDILNYVSTVQGRRAGKEAGTETSDDRAKESRKQGGETEGWRPEYFLTPPPQAAQASPGSTWPGLKIARN